MSKKLKTEAVDHLFDAILCLQNREECYTFFEDVCTVMNCFLYHSDLKWRECCGIRRHTLILRKRRGRLQRRSAVSIVL